MARIHLDQRGSSHIVALLFVVIVAAVGFAAYRVMSANKNSSSVANAPTNTLTKPLAAPADIKSKADVQQAAKALDSDQLDKNLDPSQLDSDLNSLL